RPRSPRPRARRAGRPRRAGGGVGRSWWLRAGVGRVGGRGGRLGHRHDQHALPVGGHAAQVGGAAHAHEILAAGRERLGRLDDEAVVGDGALAQEFTHAGRVDFRGRSVWTRRRGSSGVENATRKSTESTGSTVRTRGPTVSCTNAHSSALALESTVTVTVSNASRRSGRRLLFSSWMAHTR